MEKATGKAMNSQGQKVPEREERLRRMKIPKQGVCCPFCGSKESHSEVPMNCCMPTREVCEGCGKDFVLEGDEILYYA
jgi:transposase-like protein